MGGGGKGGRGGRQARRAEGGQVAEGKAECNTESVRRASVLSEHACPQRRVQGKCAQCAQRVQRAQRAQLAQRAAARSGQRLSK